MLTRREMVCDACSRRLNGECESGHEPCECGEWERYYPEYGQSIHWYYGQWKEEDNERSTGMG